MGGNADTQFVVCLQGIGHIEPVGRGDPDAKAAAIEQDLGGFTHIAKINDTQVVSVELCPVFDGAAKAGVFCRDVEQAALFIAEAVAQDVPLQFGHSADRTGSLRDRGGNSGITEDEKNEYAKAISEAARKLAQLLTNILKLNKLENQQIFPQPKEFDLSEQLCECLLVFEDAWEAKNLEIETDIQDDVRIKSDPELLSLVWNNLISNAVKFTPDGGTIGLSLKTEGSSVVVQVRDTGCGMKPEVGQHIFEKFYQGDTSHATQGNGLGLALVKRVVDILNGEIGVQSVYGQGSTFTVSIRRK